jgi:hypothetical protein
VVPPIGKQCPIICGYLCECEMTTRSVVYEEMHVVGGVVDVQMILEDGYKVTAV